MVRGLFSFYLVIFFTFLVSVSSAAQSSKNNFVLIVDKDVRDSAFHERTLPVSQGGFPKYFSKQVENGKSIGEVLFEVYSDSVSPFVEGRSENPDFLGLVSTAYAKHYAMEISPDDIWLMILDGIRLHVKVNRETLKDKFVGPGADTSVNIRDDELNFESSRAKWSAAINRIFDGLQEKLPAETGKPMKTRFSTTSDVDFTISSTMVLAVASEYYTYHVYTLCGIPKIKIKGTKEDWVKLKESYNQLAARLDLKWWADELNPVLDKFIDAQDGKIDLEFWRGIYKRFDPEGCGNPHFNGWISKFFPYTTDFEDNFRKRTDWNKRLNFNEVPKGITDVDIQWHYKGRNIPLKLYTGFIGIQYDKKTKMLKASRGYALVSLCGWCNQAKIAKNLEYIPGKAMRLQEVLAIADSMNIFGKDGLAYATNDKKELLEFAIAFDYQAEEPEDISGYQAKLYQECLTMNFYRKGELIEHSIFYRLEMKSLHGIGIFRDTTSVKEFLGKRNISMEGVSSELVQGERLPKMEIYVTDFTADKKTLEKAVTSNGIGEYKSGLANAIEFSCGWRLEQIFAKHYNDNFSLSIDAELFFDKKGKVTKVKLGTKNTQYKNFLDEFKDALYYAYMPLKTHTDIGNDVSVQGIVKTEKIHIIFTQKHRMVCKENGQDAKGEVVVNGAPKENEFPFSKGNKHQCNEITFSKDIASGGVDRYTCFEYTKKNQSSEKRKKFVFSFRKKDLKMSPAKIITLQIPACFEEVPLEK